MTSRIPEFSTSSRNILLQFKLVFIIEMHFSVNVYRSESRDQDNPRKLGCISSLPKAGDRFLENCFQYKDLEEKTKGQCSPIATVDECISHSEMLLMLKSFTFLMSLTELLS